MPESKVILEHLIAIGGTLVVVLPVIWYIIQLQQQALANLIVGKIEKSCHLNRQDLWTAVNRIDKQAQDDFRYLKQEDENARLEIANIKHEIEIRAVRNG